MFLLKKGAKKYFDDPTQSPGLGQLFQNFDEKVIVNDASKSTSKKEMELGSEEDDRQDPR